ncbi:MAG: hypothetical protein MUO26_01415 [Methanotrichaceae archaeon]|nr:hypothetical protein [Methanotrichaceae archaeon]
MKSQLLKIMFGLILFLVLVSAIAIEETSSDELDKAEAVNVTDTNLSDNVLNSFNGSLDADSGMNVTTTLNATKISSTNKTTIAPNATETDNMSINASAWNATDIVTTAANFEIDNIALENMTEEEIPFELPFSSGVSLSIKAKDPIDFKKLATFVDKQGYDVVKQDKKHVIWIFNGSTENTAYVYNDGIIIVTSTEGFNLTTKEKLMNDLLRIMLNLRFAGNDIPDKDMGAALQTANFYTEEEGIYHILNHDFNRDFDLTLSVPMTNVKEARLKSLGEDCCQDSLCLQKAQKYYIDGQLISECGSYEDKCCNVGVTEIADRIPSGDHLISAKSIDPNKSHVFIIEAVTSPKPSHMFVLRENERPITYETTTSMNLTALEDLIKNNG